MTMKRISPAPMGRAYRIRKRSNHVTIIVESKAKPSVKKAAPASKPAAKADAKAPKKKEKQVASAS
jgi:large subunit ribosomal protein L22